MKANPIAPDLKLIPLIQDFLIPVIEVSDNKLSEEEITKAQGKIPQIKEVKIPPI